MTKFKTLKPKDGLKVFNPATGRHLKPEGEEVVMSNYWYKIERSGDASEVKSHAPTKKEKETSFKK